VCDAGLYSLARSCQLGGRDRPCQWCSKCYRKQLTFAAVTGSPVPGWVLDNAQADARFAEVVGGGVPYDMQQMYEYVLPRLSGLGGTIFGGMAKMIGRSEAESTWVSAYYPPALDDVVPPWRNIVEPRVSDLVRFMTPPERETLESWSAYD
jgi:hypothetical protein